MEGKRRLWVSALTISLVDRHMIVATKKAVGCITSGTLEQAQPQSKLLQQLYEESMMKYEVTIKQTQQVMSFATVQVEGV